MKLMLTLVLKNGKQLVGRVPGMTPEEVATRLLDSAVPGVGEPFAYLKAESEAGGRVDIHVRRDDIAAVVVSPEQMVRKE